jgi:hypothetical protein
MTRAFFEEFVLFLIPFAAFAAYIVLSRRNPLTREHWDGPMPWLVVAGLAIVIASLLYAGFIAPREKGVFVPTHLENGHVVPGTFK